MKRPRISPPYENSSARQTTLVALFVLILLATWVSVSFVAPAAAQEGAGDAPGALVTTDWTDYQPGDTVIITGSGFFPGELVRIELTKDGADEGTFDAVADEYGNFVNSDYAPGEEDLGAAYGLTATGLSSNLTATARFTDGEMSYSPPQKTLPVQSGTTPQTVSSQMNVKTPGDYPTGDTTLTLGLAYTGSQPLPAGIDLPSSWVTITPTSQVYSGKNETNHWDYSITVPANTPAGSYRAYVRVTSGLPAGITPGDGQVLTIPVTNPTPTDTQPPISTASATTQPGSATYLSSTWTNKNVQVALSATDAGGSGLKNIQYSVNGAAYAVYTTPFTITAEGITTILYFATDNANNAEVPNTFVVKIDKTAPTATFGAASPAANAAGWNNTDVSVPFTASDALSGVSTTTPSASPLVLSTEGSAVTGTVTVTDNAGNSATFTSSAFKIDKTGPTATFGAGSPAANAAGWNNTDVSVPFTTSDTLSGVDTATPASPLVLSDEGSAVTGAVTVTDKAGNSAVVTSPAFKIDKTGPTISASRTPAANANGWNNTDVVASYTASDASSGLVDPATGSFTFAAEGAGQSHTFTVTDNAGNSATATVSDVNIDKTEPTLAFGAASPAANAAGWNNTDVSVQFTAGDALSGVDTTSPAASPLLLTTEGSAVTGTVTVTDKAGNSKTFTSSAVKIDKTAPTITAHRDTPANANGWNNSDVDASYTASDALSGLVESATGSFTFTAEGANQSHTFTVTDQAGNSANASVTGVNIDKTAPTIATGRTPAPNAAGWNNTDVDATYTASDALSGLDASSPATGSYTFVAEAAGQSHSFTVTDKAGNSASGTVDHVNIDKTAPTISASRTPAPNANGWNNTDVEASYTASDALSGLGSPATGSFSFSTEGANQSHAFTVSDLAGNSASATVDHVSIDKSPPVITPSRAPSPNANGWNNTDVTASYTASDAVSGLDAGSPATDSFTFTGEGDNLSHTFSVTDLAGNSVSATVDHVRIDRTKPDLTFDTPSAGWHNANVSIPFLASDGLSGVDTASPASPLVLSDEGSAVTGTVTVTDKAGNSRTFTSPAVMIDKTAPTITAHRDTPANGYGWNNTDVAASYTASDALSGLVEPATGSFTFTAEGGGQSHTFTVTDQAGNSASGTVSDVNIDRTAPALMTSRTPGPNGAGWNNTDVVASYLASDALSGLVDPATGSFTFTAQAAGQSHTFSVTDKAGNATSETVGPVNIDKTAPVITVPADIATTATTSTGAVVSYSGVSVTDNLDPNVSSSLTTTPASGSLFPLGTTTVTCTATDAAGNTATKTFKVTVSYSWSGVLQPINSDGSSIFKLGSTVPVKFQLTGASGPIGDAVANLLYRKTSNGVVGTDVEAVSTAAATSGSLFRYDPTAGQYIFNWSTKGLDKGTYLLTIDLHDGVSRTVQVSLR